MTAKQNIMKINIKSILIALIATFTLTLYSQENPKIKRSEFFAGDNGFKLAWRSVKEGNKYFKKGEGEYHLALEKYWIAYDYNPTSAALNYKIGVCYLMSGKSRVKGLEHIKKAYELDPYVAEDINLFIAHGYHLNLEFDKAIKEYNNYISQFDEKSKEIRKLGYKEIINKRIEECKNGKELVQSPKRVIIKNLKNINTSTDEYNPVFNENKDEMFYTARRESTTKEKKYKPDNKYKEDIYKAKLENETWQNQGKFEGHRKTNTKYNDGAVELTNNGKKLYIFKGDYRGSFRDGDIFVSEYKKEKWRKPKKIDKPIRSKGRETTICFTEDKKEAYFVSKREKNTFGGKDIYHVKKDAKGRWMDAKNIGMVVNTKYDEEAPYLSKGGDTLYFSSKGHNSMGGFDNFYTTKDEKGEWMEPVNMGYPVNTPNEDIYYKTGNNLNTAYISSIRDAGKGGIDIFKLIYIGDEKEMKFSSEDDELAWFKKPVPDMFYHMPKKLSIDTTLYLRGTITDKNSAEGIQAKIQLIDYEKSENIAVSISQPDGNYKLKLPPKPKKAFGVEINAKGYLFYVDSVDLTAERFTNDVAIRNFQLEKITVGGKMILKNIYFDTGKSTLKPESYEELNRVVKFLSNNESVEIEISGHTDNVGSYTYNRRLSKDRAKSVVEYLIAQGIDKSRLKYEGYAYDQPVATNATPEGRAQNRRVEFKILSVE